MTSLFLPHAQRHLLTQVNGREHSAVRQAEGELDSRQDEQYLRDLEEAEREDGCFFDVMAATHFDVQARAGRRRMRGG